PYTNPSNGIQRESIESLVRQIVRRTISNADKGGNSLPLEVREPLRVPNLRVSISARHVHLTEEHVELLFGKGHRLVPGKPLYQEGFYAAEETVMLVGPRRRMLPEVRVLGPARTHSQ